MMIFHLRFFPNSGMRLRKKNWRQGRPLQCEASELPILPTDKQGVPVLQTGEDIFPHFPAIY